MALGKWVKGMWAWVNKKNQSVLGGKKNECRVAYNAWWAIDTLWTGVFDDEEWVKIVKTFEDKAHIKGKLHSKIISADMIEFFS